MTVRGCGCGVFTTGLFLYLAAAEQKLKLSLSDLLKTCLGRRCQAVVCLQEEDQTPMLSHSKVHLFRSYNYRESCPATVQNQHIYYYYYSNLT